MVREEAERQVHSVQLFGVSVPPCCRAASSSASTGASTWTKSATRHVHWCVQPRHHHHLAQIRESVRRQQHESAAEAMRHRSEPARAVQTAAAAAPRPRRRVASKSVAVSAEQKRKEAERFTTAMLSQIRFKCKTMRIVLPPICRCQFVCVLCKDLVSFAQE